MSHIATDSKAVYTRVTLRLQFKPKKTHEKYDNSSIADWHFACYHFIGFFYNSSVIKKENNPFLPSLYPPLGKLIGITGTWKQR